MRQRVSLARTMIENKPIILMDEPFSALDTINRVKIQDVAFKFLSEHTVLLVTHDPLEAFRVAHNIVLISGTPANLKETIRLASESAEEEAAMELDQLLQQF